MTDNPNTTHASHKLLTLLNLLEEETRQCEAVTSKLQEKQEILITNQPKKLHRVDQELLAISQKAKNLEKQRLELLKELGYPNQTLTHFIAQLEPTAASTFIPCQNRLIRATEDVRRVNQDTQDLLQLSLQWIQDTVELIASIVTPEAASYNAQGGKTGQKQSVPSSAMQSTVNHSA